MLFDSYTFLFAFLPATLLLFLAAARVGPAAARLVLVLASLYFYREAARADVPLLLLSILFNYLCGLLIASARRSGRRRVADILLAVSVGTDVLALLAFKYAIVGAGGPGVPGIHLSDAARATLPLGISFFTFTQIAYLADMRSGAATQRDPLRYVLFVTFFPHLVAGPILHHAAVMPQLGRTLGRRRIADDLAVGATLFILGLAKKILLADTLQPYADNLFDHVGTAPALLASWQGSIAYALELYFDFSGYSDMAIGLARCFGVAFPLNFDSPYKARSIIDFWRRWHMTLSRFLRDYVYVPLGGSRSGGGRSVNILLTMLVGGAWHGAGLNFVLWGGLHGVYLIINHQWRRWRNGGVPVSALETAAGRGLTLLAIVVGWVLFRANDLRSAVRVLAGLVGLHGVGGVVVPFCRDAGHDCLAGVAGGPFLIAAVAAIALIAPNSQTVLGLSPPGAPRPDTGPGRPGQGDALLRWRPTTTWALLSATLFGLAMLRLGQPSSFIYYRF